MENNLKTKISDLSVEDFIKILKKSPAERKTIRGIKGLADVLDSSISTAMKIKKSGKIPYKQYGRVVLFREEDILNYKTKNS